MKLQCSRRLQQIKLKIAVDKVSVSIFFQVWSNLILIYPVYAQLVLFTIGKEEEKQKTQKCHGLR